jgi:formylglycine-generating enzyme required for sulfatase activity
MKRTWRVLLGLLLLTAPAAAQAQIYAAPYIYSVNSNDTSTITIGNYEGPGGAVAIPTTINGLTVTSIGDSAFAGYTSLASVTIPDSVNSIGDSGFGDCSGLTNVSIGNSVTNIGAAAFENCSSLTSVTIPNSVTSIGYAAFEYCGSLTGVTISATNIGDYAFFSCTGLKSVTMGNSVTSIGDSAFGDCTRLSNVTIGNSVTSIGDYAFDDTGLTIVTIPNSVTNIGDYAFGRCTGLAAITVGALNSFYSSLDGVLFDRSQTTLVEYPAGKAGGYAIPSSVTSIGTAAFWYCTGLTNVTIPNSLTNIGDYVFSGCTSLATIAVGALNSFYTSSVDGVLFNKSQTTLVQYPGGKAGAYAIPNSVTSIGDYAFDGCTSLTSVTIPNSVTSVGDSAFGDCASLTSVAIPSGVTSIGDYAFSFCSSLTSLTIPNSATNIGDYAFWYCTGLANVTIGDSATGIGESAFAQCSSLANITIGTNVTSIGDSAFYSCTSLTGVTIPNSVTSIGDSAFAQCSSLANATVGNSVTSIGDYAFSSCTGLTSFTIPNSVSNIGTYAFDACSNLANATIGNSVTNVGDYAFGQCSSLTKVTIPNSVINIGDHAFAQCSSLTNVMIGNSVTNIGDYAFAQCSSLANAEIGANVTNIGDRAFANCPSLTSVMIPNSVTNIGDYAFSFCAGLKSVTIGNGVFSIGDDAFAQCSSLSNVTIGTNVTSIGDSAFLSCTGLTSVTIPNSVTNIGEFAFDSCSRLTTVRIPNGVTNIGDYAFEGCSSLKGVYFQGNAPRPSTDLTVFSGDNNATVYYLSGTTGWGSTFDGLPTVLSSVGTCISAPPGLIGWWRCEGNGVDWVGTNNGGLSSGVTATAGMVGLALHFDGTTNAAVTIPNPPSPQALSIETWVKFDSLDSSIPWPPGLQYLVFRRNPSTASFEGFTLLKQRAAGGDQLAFVMTSLGPFLNSNIQSTNYVSTNVWYHLVGTFDGATMDLYVNGVLHASGYHPYPIDYGPRPMFFGTSGETVWDGRLAGTLDEVSLYDRALSAQEVAALYASGSSGKCLQVPWAPGFQAVARGNGTISLTWVSTVGRTYQVQCTTNLSQGNWVNLGAATTAAGSTDSTSDSTGPDRQRFYRVAVEPLPNPDPGLFVWIPAGRFVMGSPDSEVSGGSTNGETQHTVTLTEGFYMSKYLVTQGDYLSLTGNDPSYFSGDPALPVEQVSWFEATNYCASLTQREQAAGRLPPGWIYRLPTESEWEYACRAGTTTAFYFGDTIVGGRVNFDSYYEYDSGTGDIYESSPAGYVGRTTPVGSYAPNPWGLYDMCGNLMEWCQDWYGTYPAGSVTDPVGTGSAVCRVFRGGAWWLHGRWCRSAYRGNNTPDSTGNGLGFRTVLAPAQP